MYELVYARPNGAPTTIWSVPSNHGLLEMSPVKSAFEGDGMVTALFYCGPGGADVMFVQAQINPALKKPRALQLGQISSGSGFEEAKTLRLLDHHHFDATNTKGETNHVAVNTKNYTATMDGKPVGVMLYTTHPVVLPEDALVTPDDVFDGKVDESAIPVRTPANAAAALPSQRLPAQSPSSRSAGASGETTDARASTTTAASGPERPGSLSPWIVGAALLIALGALFAIIKRAK